MSVICTNIAVRVVVVKVAVDRSRRVACRRFAGLTCRRSKNAVNLSVCALLSLRLRRCPCRRFLHARPCLSVLLRKPAADSLRLVREMRRRVRRRRRGARRKSLQDLSVSARCRGRCCRRGGRESRCNICLYLPVAAAGVAGGAEGKVVATFACIRPLPRQVFVGAAQGRGGVRFPLVFVCPIALGHKSLLCIKYLSPSVSAQTIEICHRSFGLHKMPAAAGIGANDTRRL